MKETHTGMVVRSIRVPRQEIGYLRWCLESHDGIATPTTRGDDPEIIDLSIAPGFLDDAEALIDALEKEIGVQRVSSPKSSPLQRATVL